MAIQSRYYFDRVYETSRTSGTGSLTLDGAVTGYLSFADGVSFPASAAASEQRFTYVIEAVDVRGVPTGMFEIGRGYVYTSGGVSTLVRENVIKNHNNTTSKVEFSDDLKNVYIDVSADDLNYLIEGVALNAAEVETNKNTAVASAQAAKASEDAAKASEEAAKASEDAAKASQERTEQNEELLAAAVSSAAASASAAKTSEDNAKASETAAKTSEDNAKTSETNAKTSETNAATSEDNANTYLTQAIAAKNAAETAESHAKASEDAAKTSEDNAKTSETNAKTSETNAAESARQAKVSEDVLDKYAADTLHDLTAGDNIEVTLDTVNKVWVISSPVDNGEDFMATIEAAMK